MATFQINAYYDSRQGESTAQQIQVQAVVADVETAEAIAAQFPKSHRTYISSGKRYPSGERFGAIGIKVQLTANGNNDGKNETGIKRYRTFVAKAIKLGHTVEFATNQATNAYQSADALDAALA